VRPILLAATVAALAVAWFLDSSSVHAGPPARIEPLTAEGLPNVQARAALVMDAATGRALYTKDPDAVGGIASTSKIFVAMVVRRHGIDLDGATEITREDRDFAIGGARTRLDVGHSFRNRDLLHAMLVASDNRAPTALGRAVGLTPDALIAAMNALAAELGLVHTRFTDPSGLRGNVSTAREMVIAFQAALADPVLAEIMGTREVTVRPVRGRATIHYRNSNRALHSDRYEVLGGKTGFTNAAGYCLLIAAQVDGRTLLMVFLGVEQKLTRYGDFERVSRWVMDGRVPPADALEDVARSGPTINPATMSERAR
jgi:serine-type D-Ala-D-Ala endopeptidase (penicillin-binding protein 7)